MVVARNPTGEIAAIGIDAGGAGRRGPLEALEASASKKRQLLAFERTIVEPQHIRLFHTVPMFADPGQFAGARVWLDHRVQQAVQ